jgi:hypothetical protein
MATLTPIVFQKRLAAAAADEPFYLAEHIDVLKSDHPNRTFVELMCCYAGTVLRGEQTGPYADDSAERGEQTGPYADDSAEHCVRNVLMPDHDFIAHWYDRDAELAERYAVPREQIPKKRLDLRRAERL